MEYNAVRKTVFEGPMSKIVINDKRTSTEEDRNLVKGISPTARENRTIQKIEILDKRGIDREDTGSNVVRTPNGEFHKYDNDETIFVPDSRGSGGVPRMNYNADTDVFSIRDQDAQALSHFVALTEFNAALDYAISHNLL